MKRETTEITKLVAEHCPGVVYCLGPPRSHPRSTEDYPLKSSASRWIEPASVTFRGG